MREIKIGLIQMPVGDSLERNLRAASKLGSKAFRSGAQIICFPEYFGFPPRLSSIHQGLKLSSRIMEFLEKLSSQGICIGNCLEQAAGGYILNCCYIFGEGEMLGKQYKLHPTQGERSWGISPGAGLDVFRIHGINLGILICADILYPEASRVLGIKSADLVFNPVISIYRSHDPLRKSRIWMYVTRALDNGFFVAKVGGVGTGIFGDVVVGRSLVAAPWGILARARNQSSPQVILAQLDFEELNRSRKLHSSLELRNPEAYRELVSLSISS